MKLVKYINTGRVLNLTLFLTTILFHKDSEIEYKIFFISSFHFEKWKIKVNEIQKLHHIFNCPGDGLMEKLKYLTLVNNSK